MIIRGKIKRFAEEMEKKMQRNDHKGGWASCSESYLLGRLKEEVRELEGALSMRCEHCQNPSMRTLKQRSGNEKDNIVKEAADVANFAMMLANKNREF